ncbi:hypothetical protein EJB05_28164, partial [Eragrostis curvula]
MYKCRFSVVVFSPEIKQSTSTTQLSSYSYMNQFSIHVLIKCDPNLKGHESQCRNMIGRASNQIEAKTEGKVSLVLEKSETLRADGVGIEVHANGWRVLEQLGVADELRGTANLITAAKFADAHQLVVAMVANQPRPSGKELAAAHIDRFSFNEKAGKVSYFLAARKEEKSYTNQSNLANTIWLARHELRWLKRKDLIDTLAKNIPAKAFRFGCHIASIHSDPGSHVTVLKTVDGATMRAKIQYNSYLKNSSLASNCRSSLDVMAQTQWLPSTDFVFGCFPVTDNLVGFFVSCSDPSADMIDDMSIMKDFMLNKLQECPAKVIEVIKNSDPESWHVATKLYYRHLCQVMFGRFQKGTVTVAGDAMHVMGPFIGQGGAAGMEDAIVLARSLWRATARGLDIEGAGSSGEPCAKMVSAAIRDYIKERRLRVASLSLETFAVGALLIRAKTGVAKLSCMIILAVLGHKASRHANYDCGRL